MSSNQLSRRRMMTLIGAAVALVPVATLSPSRASAAPKTPSNPADRPAQPVAGAFALVAPLVAGSQLGAWRVERGSEVRHGAVTIALRDAHGEEFFLDVCHRDNGLGAPQPPARSERCEVFVANVGDGAKPTNEAHGQAAMALAEILRANEQRAGVAGLLTLRDRLARFPGQVLRGF